MILVGEIRDLETAQIAVQASLTGHLGAHDACTPTTRPSSIIRSCGPGHVEPFLLTATIEGIVAQRLVRTLDPNRPRKPFTFPARQELMELSLRPEDVKGRRVLPPEERAKAVGGGYKGRMALFEIMTVDDEMRELIINEREHLQVLAERYRARRGCGRCVRAGCMAIYEGATTIDEVVRETIEAE